MISAMRDDGLSWWGGGDEERVRGVVGCAVGVGVNRCRHRGVWILMESGYRLEYYLCIGENREPNLFKESVVLSYLLNR